MNTFRNSFIRSEYSVFPLIILIFNLTSCFAQTPPSTTPKPTPSTTASAKVEDCPSADSTPQNFSEWQGSELNKAVVYSDAGAVRNLLKQKNAVNEKDNFGNTPLMNAVSRKISEPSAKNNETILREARKQAKTQLEIAQLLLENGADAGAKGFAGRTPLIKAVTLDESVAAKLINLLIQSSKEVVNAQDKQGYTALMEAARTNRIEIIKILLKNGADKNLKTCDGQTAFSIAKQLNFTMAMRLLN